MSSVLGAIKSLSTNKLIRRSSRSKFSVFKVKENHIASGDNFEITDKLKARFDAIEKAKYKRNLAIVCAMMGISVFLFWLWN